MFPWRNVPTPLRFHINLDLQIAGVAALFSVGSRIWWFLDQSPGRRVMCAAALFCVVGAVFALGDAICLMYTRSILEVDSEGLRFTEQQGLIRRLQRRKWRNVARLATATYPPFMVQMENMMFCWSV